MSTYRANLDDLSNTEELFAGTAGSHATFHPSLEKMFLAGGGSVRCGNLDGSDLQTLVTGLGSPGGIELDIHGGKMYWRDWSTDKIQRANLDGSDVEDVVDARDADFISFLYSIQ